jgi:integrase
VGKLTNRRCQTAGPGKHADGNNLYLYVTAGSRSWVYRYRMDARSREMGLGGYPAVTLAQAREAGADAKRLQRQGIDPLKARKAEEPIPAFSREAARQIRAHRKGWVRRWARQQVSLLRRYAGPIKDMPVDEIETADALRVLKPVWTEIPHTADVLRLRCEAVLDAATALGHREGPNPFRWRGGLAHLLPAKRKIHRVEHFAAVEYQDVPALLSKLPDTIAAKALRFTALTAARSGEGRFATWDEVNGETWTLPPDRTKQGRKHEVPLSAQALAILESPPRFEGEKYIFPGIKRGKPIGQVAMLRALQRVEPDATVHGLRASFRTWAEEQTGFPRIVCEMSLGHEVGSDVERSYRRTDLFDRRRELMAAWGAYCAAPAGEKVVPIHRGRQGA